jgi:hypothetical protein
MINHGGGGLDWLTLAGLGLVRCGVAPAEARVASTRCADALRCAGDRSPPGTTVPKQ